MSSNNPSPPKTDSLSNTIALEVLMLDNGVEPTLARAVCMEIGRTAEKSATGWKPLDESQLEAPNPFNFRPPTGETGKQVIAKCLVDLTGEPVIVDYIGVANLCSADRNRSREGQMNLYRLIRYSPMRKVLNLGGGIRRDKLVTGADHLEFQLRREIKRAIGTHKLEDALDARFGNLFSKMIKDNVIDLWFGYLRAVIQSAKNPKLTNLVQSFGALCEMNRKAPILGRHRDENRWIIMVHSSNGKDLA